MIATLKTVATRNRKTLAIAGSVGLHLILVWLFLLPSSNPLADLDKRAYGQLTETGIDVDLFQPSFVPPAPAPSAPPATPPAAQALSAFAKMSEPTTAAAPTPLSTPSPARSLSEALGKDVFAPSPAPPQRAQTQHPSDKESHVKLTDQADRTTPNDLWKAIEPCWRRMAARDTEGVTLSVSFSPLGNLAKPPVIMRANGVRLDERTLKSESLAISALAQCGPYLMAFGQSDVSVHFPAGG